MPDIYSLYKNNWKFWSVISVLIILLVSCFYLNFFYHDKSLNENSLVKVSGTKVVSVPNTTFIKSYRLLVFTKINGAWPTQDGGYIVSGITDPNVMFVPPDGFVAKLDKQGNTQWVKLLKTTNAAGAGNPRGEEDVQSIIELKNGGYLMVSKVWGFIKTAEWTAEDTELNKIMFTKLDKKGNAIWSKSFTAFVEDAHNSVLETADNGFLFYAPIVDLSPDNRGEDSDVYQDLPFASLKVLKLDRDGNLQWSKNIKNFISRSNDSYVVQTADGGYALAGDLTEPNAEKEPPYDYDSYPALAKFDKSFNFQWAKTLEGTPLEIAAAIPKAGGGYEIGSKKIRQPAGIIQGLLRTPDNGLLVLGTGPSALSLVPNVQEIAKGDKSGLIAFKFDSSGRMKWVKKMTLSFHEFTSVMTEFSVSLTSDKQIMLVGPFTWADQDYAAKAKAVNDQVKWYNDKYGAAEMSKEESDKTKESRADYKKVAAVIKTAADAFRPGVFMMKMDPDFNVVWTKIANPQRGITNYVLKPTADSGAIVAGEYVTEVVKSVLYGTITYYKDGFVMKLDGGGNAAGAKNWLVDYSGAIAAEPMTPYAVSNSLQAQTEDYKISLTKRQPEFSAYTKTKVSTYAPYVSSKTTAYFTPVTVPATGTAGTNASSTPTAAKTWPQINYERATATEPINDKSRTIHNELLPILNQLFNNQVKLTDNMGGAMLSYDFDRIVVAGDITAVKNYLVGLGYKTQDEGQYQLTMYKPGYFLVMTFSINNTNKAFLDVTY